MNRLLTVLTAIIAFSVGGAAQAVEPSFPELDGLLDYDAIVDFDLIYADLEVIDVDTVKGFGTVRHFTWTTDAGASKQVYRAAVTVRVPARVPGLESFKSAMNADVLLVLDHKGMPYAECLLAVQPITSRTYVTYELELLANGDFVKPTKGVCDVDLETPDIQVGIPPMRYLDLVTGVIRHQVPHDIELMRGFCF